MTIIAVTGGIGSGKSTVCHEFAKLGGYIIDADNIAHKIILPTLPAYNDIVEYFGNSLLNGDKTINRHKLGDIVFADKEKLKILESITHKHIIKEIENSIDKNKNLDIIVLDVPLLFEKSFSVKYDYAVAVIADNDLRIARAAQRDNVSPSTIEKRMNLQFSNSEYVERAHFVVKNNGDINELKRQVKEIYNKIKV